MGVFLDSQWQTTPNYVIRSGRNLNSFLDIMHVLNMYKFKMDQINSNQEKVATLIFRCSGAAISVARGRLWSNFKLIQALMYAMRNSGKRNRKAMNRNWSNQKANPAFKTKVGNK